MQEVVYQFYSLQALAYKPAMMLTSCFPFIFHIYVSKTSFRGMVARILTIEILSQQRKFKDSSTTSCSATITRYNRSIIPVLLFLHSLQKWRKLATTEKRQILIHVHHEQITFKWRMYILIMKSWNWTFSIVSWAFKHVCSWAWSFPWCLNLSTYIAQKEMLVKIYALRVNVANLQHCNPHRQKYIYSTEAPWYIAVHWRLSSANCEV